MVKTQTTRAQYSGLNCSGLSTTINLIGLLGSIDGMRREMWRMEADEEVVARDESGGM